MNVTLSKRTAPRFLGAIRSVACLLGFCGLLGDMPLASASVAGDEPDHACPSAWLYETDACHEARSEAPCPALTYAQIQTQRLAIRHKDFGVDPVLAAISNLFVPTVTPDSSEYWTVSNNHYHGHHRGNGVVLIPFLCPQIREGAASINAYLDHPAFKKNSRHHGWMDDFRRIAADYETKMNLHLDQCRVHARARMDEHVSCGKEEFEGLECWCERRPTEDCVRHDNNDSSFTIGVDLKCKAVAWKSDVHSVKSPFVGPFVDDITRPLTFENCRSTAFDLEPTNVCAAPRTLTASPAGLTVARAAAAAPFFFSAQNQRDIRPFCAVHPALPVGTRAEVRAKFDALKRSAALIDGALDGSFDANDDASSIPLGARDDHRSNLHAVRNTLDGELRNLVLTQVVDGVDPREALPYLRPPYANGDDLAAQKMSGVWQMCAAFLGQNSALPTVQKMAQFCLQHGGERETQRHVDDHLRQVPAQSAVALHKTMLLHGASMARAALKKVDVRSATLDADMAVVGEIISRVLDYGRSHERDPEADATMKGLFDAYRGLLAAGENSGDSSDHFNRLSRLLGQLVDYRDVLTDDFFVAMVTDIIEQLSVFVQDAALLHDVGCRFGRRSCHGRKDDLYRLNAAVALLDDPPDAHGAALAPVCTERALDAAINSLMQLRDKHAIAHRRAAVSDNDSDLTRLDRFVSEARRRKVLYETTGFYDFKEEKKLAMGLHVGQRDRVVARLRDLKLRLDDAESGLHNYRRERLQNMRHEAEADLRLQQIDTAIAGLLVQDAAHYRGIQASRFDIGTQLHKRSQRVGAAKDLARHLQRRSLQSVVHDITLTVAATRARAHAHETAISVADVAVVVDTPGGWFSPATSAVWHHAADAGDTLMVSATGRWTPACAIRTAPLPKRGTSSVLAGMQVGDPLTGPEGYQVRGTKDGYRIESANRSQDEVRSHEHGHSHTTCESESSWAGLTFTPGYMGISAGGSSSWSRTSADCDLESNTERSSISRGTSEHEGVSSHLSFDYLAGTRLDVNPFPNFPTGSLLLVEMPRGHHALADASRVHVVTDGIAVTAAVDADYYLVVNDVTHPSCASLDKHALSVRIIAQRPNASQVQKAYARLGAIAEELELSPPASVEEGTLTSSQVQGAYADAVASLHQAVHGLDWSSPLGAELEAALRHELSMLELRTLVNNLQKQRTALAAQINGLMEEKAALARLGKVTRLASVWAAQTFDTEILRWAVQDVAHTLNNALWSVLDLRYSGILDDSSALNARLTRLVGELVDFNVEAGLAGSQSDGMVAPKLLRDLLFVLGDLLNAWAVSHGDPITEEATGGRSRDLPMFTVVIPRPGHGGTGSYEVDAARAALFWNAIDHPAPGKNASITVDIRDLYRYGDSEALNLRSAAPIVHRMGLFLRATDSAKAERLNEKELRIPVEMSPAMVIAKRDGPQTYAVGDGLGLCQDAALVMGGSSMAISTLRNFRAPHLAGRGGSPFRTFTFEAKNFAQTDVIVKALPDVTAAVLVFELDYQSLNSVPDWLSP